LNFAAEQIAQGQGPGNAGYLLVVDWKGDCVRRYDAATGESVNTIVPKHIAGMNTAYGVLFGPHDHNLYVSTGEIGGPGQIKAVLRYDGVTGAFMDEFTQGGDLRSPRGIIFGPDGNLYVAERIYIGRDWSLEGRVARYDGMTGTYLDDFVPLGSGGLSIPTQLVFGPSGRPHNRLDLYVLSLGNDSVKRYDGATGAYLGDFVASGSGGLDGPGTMTFGPDGKLYVANFYSSDLSVKRFEGPSGPTPGAFIDAFIPAGSGGLAIPSGLIFGPDGNDDGQLDLYVATLENGNIKGRVNRHDGMTGAFIDTYVAGRSGGLEGPALMTFTQTDPVTLDYLGE
jgi:DNA-binding beta-propeller fold protein YncE